MNASYSIPIKHPLVATACAGRNPAFHCVDRPKIGRESNGNAKCSGDFPLITVVLRIVRWRSISRVQRSSSIAKTGERDGVPSWGRGADVRGDRIASRVAAPGCGSASVRRRYWTGSCDVTQFEDSTQSENKEDSVRDFDKRSTGELYRIDPDGSIATMERNVVTANGPAFSPDGKTIYFNDSLPRVTWAYDLAEDWSISNRRDWLKYGDDDGCPVEMAVDVEGGIWIAFYESWVLRRYSPDGVVLDERRLPVRQGLRPGFGGANMERLFLTSAANALSEQAKVEQPVAGSVFEILDPGVRGMPNVAFAG